VWRGLGVALLAVLVLAAPATPGGTSRYVVARVADGDTLTLTSGSRVRLLQIDSPEVGTGECYARGARGELLRLAPVGSRVALEADPALDRVDRYGRLLRYVKHGTLDVNLELVRRGAAAPYFFGGDRGRYASRLMAAAVVARAHKRGLWGASPGTRLDPYRQVDTGSCGRR
jgi:micrococcal nuclease